MKSENKKRNLTRQRRTPAIAPGLNNAGIGSRVVKTESNSPVQGRAIGGRFLDMTASQLGPPALEEILIDVDTDVDTYEDGMAFRFTWR